MTIRLLNILLILSFVNPAFGGWRDRQPEDYMLRKRATNQHELLWNHRRGVKRKLEYFLWESKIADYIIYGLIGSVLLVLTAGLAQCAELEGLSPAEAKQLSTELVGKFTNKNTPRLAPELSKQDVIASYRTFLAQNGGICRATFSLH